MIGIFNDCYPPVIDGVSMTVQNYARWLNRKCNDVCVVTPSVPGAVYEEDFPVYGYFSVPIPMRKPYRMGLPLVDRAFLSRMGKTDFSIVHAHSPFSSGRLALRLARQRGVPVVATFHSKYRADFERVIPNKAVVDYLVKGIVDFYNEIQMVTEDVLKTCTSEKCPTMSAGPKYQYLWQDNDSYKSPTAMPAHNYINLLFQWVDKLLDDQNIFPADPSIPFPKNFKDIIKNICKRLFRVYAHIYHHHFDDIKQLNTEAEFNTAFRHFYTFLKEFDLIPVNETEPLQQVINSFSK